MSDYDRKNERHWLPGEGVIDWTELLSALVESGYEGPFIYEASKGKKPNRRQMEKVETGLRKHE